MYHVPAHKTASAGSVDTMPLPVGRYVLCHGRWVPLGKQPTGYYVMGRYTSVAWFVNRADAERVAASLNARGGRSHVEPSY